MGVVLIWSILSFIGGAWIKFSAPQYWDYHPQTFGQAMCLFAVLLVWGSGPFVLIKWLE